MILAKEKIPLAVSEASERNPIFIYLFFFFTMSTPRTLGGVKTADVGKINCFLKVAFFIVFSVM